MTYDELRKRLTNSCLFSDDEVAQIVKTCGCATMGTAVVACEILGIELCGNDVNIMFAQEN